MDTLQKLLDEVIQKSFSKEKIIVRLLAKKLKEKGIVLSKKQLQELECKIESGEDLSNFQIDEKEAEEISSTLNVPEMGSISIQFDPEKDIIEINDEISKILQDAIPAIASDAAKIVFKTLKKNFNKYKKEFRKTIKAFTKGIEKSWGKAIDLLEMFYYISFESGDQFNSKYRPIAVQKNDLVFDVISRLHARSCQICSEILCLLKNGFADGAHARWRTLHEIAVIAIFVQNHGNEVAERYLLHDGIESFRAANKYKECSESLGYENITEEEFDSIKNHYERLVAKFGRSYKNEYGWASQALNKDKPTFSDIEQSVGLGHMRTHYKMASHNVHANPKGVFFKLGLLPESEDFLLSGPSNLGFTDPAHCTAISLSQITSALLTIDSNLDRLVICNILHMLEHQIGEEFFEVQRAIEAT